MSDKPIPTSPAGTPFVPVGEQFAYTRPEPTSPNHHVAYVNVSPENGGAFLSVRGDFNLCAPAQSIRLDAATAYALGKFLVDKFATTTPQPPQEPAMACPRRLFVTASDQTPDHWDENGVCSYCGSLHPDTFMARVEAGTLVLGTTVKPNKVYVTPVKGTEPLPSIKFYFEHLSPEQAKRFVDLFNERKLRFDGGVGFTVLPFFMIWPGEAANDSNPTTTAH